MQSQISFCYFMEHYLKNKLDLLMANKEKIGSKHYSTSTVFMETYLEVRKWTYFSFVLASQRYLSQCFGRKLAEKNFKVRWLVLK